MAFHRAGSLAEVPRGTVIQLEIGGQTVALANVDGNLFALDGICPHNGGPLAHGALHGRTMVCPWHAWEFDCETGAYDRNPALRLARFAVRVEGGEIWIDVDARA